MGQPPHAPRPLWIWKSVRYRLRLLRFWSNIRSLGSPDGHLRLNLMEHLCHARTFAISTRALSHRTDGAPGLPAKACLVAVLFWCSTRMIKNFISHSATQEDVCTRYSWCGLSSATNLA